MPTYDYECRECGHGFEHFQSMSSRVLRKCPACGKPKLQRLIGSGAAVLFKGSGFYETDYKRSRSRDGASAKSEGAAAGKGAGDAQKAKDSSTGQDATPKPSGGSKPSGDAKPAGDAKPSRGGARKASD